MKSVLFTLTIFLAIAVQKLTREEKQVFPECVQTKIQQHSTQHGCGEPDQVRVFEREGKKLYRIESWCGTAQNLVVDENCDQVYGDGMLADQ